MCGIDIKGLEPLATQYGIYFTVGFCAVPAKKYEGVEGMGTRGLWSVEVTGYANVWIVA